MFVRIFFAIAQRGCSIEMRCIDYPRWAVVLGCIAFLSYKALMFPPRHMRSRR